MAPSGVFYVLGGLWEIMLCLAVFTFLATQVRSLWTDLARAAMMIGMVEGAMISGCKILIVGQPPAGMTQCNYVTGIPIGDVVATLELMALGFIFAYWHRRDK